MLKKRYKPSRLNKWYTKHFVLTPCMRGVEVSETVVVWWCFLASIYNSKFFPYLFLLWGKYLSKYKRKEMKDLRFM